MVAPYTGAWIETNEIQLAFTIASVAPYTGAWIETYLEIRESMGMASHLIQVRGLKLTQPLTLKALTRRTLYRCVD